MPVIRARGARTASRPWLTQRGLPPYESGRHDPLVEATAYPDAGAVLIVVDWGTPGVTDVTLTRINPDGTTAVVRGSPVRLSGGRAVWWDAEAPLNVEVIYRASSVQASTTWDSNPVTLTAAATGTSGWLSDPLAPALNIPLAPFAASPPPNCDPSIAAISFQLLADEAYDDANGVFPILGSARPRTVTDVRRAETGTLGLISRTRADHTRLAAILSTGRDLLLRLASVDYGWATETGAAAYITIGKVSVTRPGLADMTAQQRVWRMPYAVVDAPSTVGTTPGGGVTGATWGDLLATGKTWGDLLIPGSERTWFDILRGQF